MRNKKRGYYTPHNRKAKDTKINLTVDVISPVMATLSFCYKGKGYTIFNPISYTHPNDVGFMVGSAIGVKGVKIEIYKTPRFEKFIKEAIELNNLKTGSHGK